jgi:hypothetical protein
MSIQGGGVITEVSREFDFERTEMRTADNRVAGAIEHPELAHAVQVTAEAALRIFTLN